MEDGFDTRFWISSTSSVVRSARPRPDQRALTAPWASGVLRNAMTTPGSRDAEELSYELGRNLGGVVGRRNARPIRLRLMIVRPASMVLSRNFRRVQRVGGHSAGRQACTCGRDNVGQG